MSRRFSDEPINLIRRIPTQEQLDASRPAKRSFGEKIADTAASFVRSVADLSAQVMSPRRAESASESNAVLQEGPHELQSKSVVPESESSGREIDAEEHRVSGLEEAAATAQTQWPENPSLAVMPSVQQEEMAEIRAYILSQQQDIARLAVQIQELKSLVVSQQQILAFLSKEFEGSSLSQMARGVASGVGKRNRPTRPKPVMKNKVVATEDDPVRLPFNM